MSDRLSSSMSCGLLLRIVKWVVDDENDHESALRGPSMFLVGVVRSTDVKISNRACGYSTHDFVENPLREIGSEW